MTLSFLTIGLQTAVNLAAGAAKMPSRLPVGLAAAAAGLIACLLVRRRRRSRGSAAEQAAARTADRVG